MKIRYTLLWCSFLFLITWGCTTIQKVFHKQKQTVDSTVIYRTDSLAYHQKVVKEGYGLSVRFDTGCTNTFTINPTTGIIQASGGVAGVSFTGTKEGKEVDSTRLQKESETILQKEVKTIHKQTTKKVVPWWCYAIGIAGVLYVVYRLYKAFPFKIPF